MLFIVPVPPEGKDEKAPEPLPRGRPEAWADLAESEGGEVKQRGRKISKVYLPHGAWTLVLETFSEGEGGMSTRLRVRMRTRAPFRLRIFQDNAFYRLAKRFGMKDVSVPNPAIDRAFVIQTDSESVVRSLLLERRLAGALLALPKSRIDVVPVKRGLRKLRNVAELRWAMSGVLKDRERLDLALQLARALLDGLIRLGVAVEPYDR